MKQKEISEQVALVRRMYDEGETESAIFAALGQSREIFRDRCKRAGLEWWLQLPLEKRDPEKWERVRTSWANNLSGKHYLSVPARKEAEDKKHRAQAEAISKLIQEGRSQTAILESLNISEKVLRKRCREYGLDWWLKLPQQERDPERYDTFISKCREAAINNNRQLTEEEFAQKVHERSGGRLEYVSGFTDTDGHFIARCTTCGTKKEYACSTIRTAWFRDVIQCKRCISRQTEKRLAEKTAKSFERKQIKGKQIEFAVCRQCGALFPLSGGRKIFCSDECMRKYGNSQGSYKRDKRIKERTKDKDITLEKLYERDGGRCYLCGCKCDWDDCEREGGAFIAGDKYPSIEHVVPLSKGGEHSWENVKLACRRCNYLKSDTAPLKIEGAPRA